MPIITEIEERALEVVMPQAQSRARDFLCPDCLDRRCLANLKCNAFILLSKGYAWEIVAEKAELN